MVLATHATHPHNIREAVLLLASVALQQPEGESKMSLKRKYSAMSSEYSDSDDVHDDTKHGGDRKKKRGEIEKKRRDRINDCLNEIKDLVPTAMEKSSVNKLEKAEILQMTVDHLKSLHNNPDRSRSMLEHQNAGFRECMGEVSRYLVAVEGMHLEDPLRLRLMSHLHAFSTATTGPQSWLGHPYHHYEDPQYVLTVPPTISMDKNVRDKTYQQPRPCYSEGGQYTRAVHQPHYRPWGGNTGGY